MLPSEFDLEEVIKLLFKRILRIYIVFCYSIVRGLLLRKSHYFDISPIGQYPITIFYWMPLAMFCFRWANRPYYR